jgi:hypothetical protein
MYYYIMKQLVKSFWQFSLTPTYMRRHNYESEAIYSSFSF